MFKTRRKKKTKLKTLIDKHNLQIKSLSVFNNLFWSQMSLRKRQIKNMFNYKIKDLEISELCKKCLFHVKKINDFYKFTKQRIGCGSWSDKSNKKLISCNEELKSHMFRRLNYLFGRFLSETPLTLANANLIVNYYFNWLRYQSENLTYLDKKFFKDNCSGKDSKRECQYIKQQKKEWAKLNINGVNVTEWYSLPRDYYTLSELQNKMNILIIKLRNNFAINILIMFAQKKIFLDELLDYINIIKINKLNKSLSNKDTNDIYKRYDMSSLDIFQWSKIMNHLSVEEVVSCLRDTINSSDIDYHTEGDGMASLLNTMFVYGDKDDLKYTDSLPCNCICHSLLFNTILESTGYPTKLIYLNLQDTHWGSGCKDIYSETISNYYEVSYGQRGKIIRLNYGNNKDKTNIFFNYTIGIQYKRFLQGTDSYQNVFSELGTSFISEFSDFLANFGYDIDAYNQKKFYE